MKWKCKQTGNVIDLPDWEDDNMKGHEGYEKVLDEPTKQQESTKPAKKTSTKD